MFDITLTAYSAIWKEDVFVFNSLKNPKVRNAILIGTLCSLSYLGVYFARNILSAVTPQIIASTSYNEEYIGSLSSLYFGSYAIGQLINGVIGDKVRARFMISFGLILAGVCNFCFPCLISRFLHKKPTGFVPVGFRF